MKRTILKIAVVTLAMITAGGTAYAGGPKKGGHDHERGDGHRVERRLEKMTERLELDASQQARVKEILTAAKAEKKALWKSSKAEGDRDAKRVAMKELRERTRTQIDAVLTPAQREEAEAFRAERKARRGERGEHGKRGHHGKRHGGKMGVRAALRGIELDESQRDAIKALSKQAREDVRQLVEEQHDGDWKAARGDVKFRREQLVTAVRAQLTAEQAAAFDQNLAELEAKRAERRGK